MSIIVKANAIVHIIAIILLLIKDLFSLILYALLTPFKIALNAEDADHMVNAAEAPSNPPCCFSTTSIITAEVSSTTLVGSTVLNPSNICIESKLLYPIKVITNIKKGKNDKTK